MHCGAQQKGLLDSRVHGLVYRLVSQSGYVVVDDTNRPQFDTSSWPWVVSKTYKFSFHSIMAGVWMTVQFPSLLVVNFGVGRFLLTKARWLHHWLLPTPSWPGALSVLWNEPCPPAPPPRGWDWGHTVQQKQQKSLTAPLLPAAWLQEHAYVQGVSITYTVRTGVATPTNTRQATPTQVI